MKINVVRTLVAVGVIGLLASCASGPPPKDYTAFRSEDPHSILVVPALNSSTQVNAPDFFLSTISRPFAERGYYVFPAHMVKRVLEEDGLSDAGLVHGADPRRLGALFGCNSVLFITIDKWTSQYIVIETTTTVQFDYELKSCTTGATLWKDSQAMEYTPHATSGGNILGQLVADAIMAAIEKSDPNYMPLTQQANLAAATTPGRGIPAGPYSTNYRKDGAEFPSGLTQ